MNCIIRTLCVLLTGALTLFAQNLLTNGGFESDGAGWNLYTNGSAAATISYPNSGAQEGTKFARVQVTAITANNWDIQLQDPAWTSVSGTEYHLSLYAKADTLRKIQVAVAGNSTSPYSYRTGSEFALTKTWKKIDVYFKSDVAGAGALNFNFYCGYGTGTYDFDNVIIEASSITYPSTITIPAQSAWQSGTHRNLFKELGYTDAQIDQKVNAAFQQLFFGDYKEEAIYTPVGTDMGYINNPNSNPAHILTEGQSYGMMITVQMNRQDIFDRLWKFAYTYMMHHTGDRKGYFAWRLYGTSPYAMEDQNPAPDGEEYFVTSLLFAAKRWGNKEGIFNYQAQADSILTEMLHKTPNSTVVAEINPDHAMIVFTPDARSTNFYTDPSYHLPGFYSVWEKLASSDNAYWKKMADSSRAFFKRACHPTTGLVTDYAAFDGKPQAASFNRFADLYHSDSWRSPVNIAMDYAWCKADPWQIEEINRLLTFFNSQPGDYKQTYKHDGTIASETDTGMVTYSASAGQIACNAVGALASTDPIAWKFVDRFWKLPIVSGTWRYYSGLLQMLNMLHVSGKFVIWGNPAVGVNFDFRAANQLRNAQLQGALKVIDLNGRVVATLNQTKSLSVNEINCNLFNAVFGTTISNNSYFIVGKDTDGKAIIKNVNMVK